MLLALTLKNFTIIDDLSVNFGPGLNIITGETGAGKSVIVDAVNIILGAKAGPEDIKTGREEAHLEALFDISGMEQTKETLESAGIEAPGDELLIKRVLFRKGRSRVFINGAISTFAILERVTDGIIDIFSQHPSPAGMRRLGAQSQVTQCRLGQDGDGKLNRALHDQGR